ncbi:MULTISPECIES: ABC transporter substrate-binding protein [unclassified Paenibacillus]|uniref:ABC transporter substrate-binding protein n=1 Tax=unclassified Paenibacillus TaxID=185978 RepID=UPI00363AC117
MIKKRNVLIAGAVSLSMLAGCTGAPGVTPPTSTKPGNEQSPQGSNDLDWSKTGDPTLKDQTINVLWATTSGGESPRIAMVKKFTEKTGIKVNIMGVDYTSLYSKITTSAMSNSTDIDVVEMDTIWAGQFFKGNLAEDLTQVIPKDVQARFTPSSLSSVTYNGHVMAMPWYSSTKHLYWNKELLAKAGISAPPRTWDEFREVSKKLTTNGVYASGWSWKQSEALICDYVSLTYAFGGQFFDNSGKPSFNQGGGVKALQFMIDLLKDKTVDPASLQWSEEDVSRSFAAGKLAMMSAWEGHYPELNEPDKSSVVNKTDVTLMPGKDNVISAAVTGSEGLAIMKSSKRKQAALTFLKWTGEKEYQMDEFTEEGFYPTLLELYKSPDLKLADTTQTLTKISEQFNYGKDRPNAPGYVNWSDTLAGELHNALLGQKTPENALNDAAKKIEKAIADSSK